MKDIATVRTSIDGVHEQLNSLIDQAFKARQMPVVNALDRASKALILADGHLAQAHARSQPATEK